MVDYQMKQENQGRYVNLCVRLKFCLSYVLNFLRTMTNSFLTSTAGSQEAKIRFYDFSVSLQ